MLNNINNSSNIFYAAVELFTIYIRYFIFTQLIPLITARFFLFSIFFPLLLFIYAFTFYAAPPYLPFNFIYKRIYNNFYNSYRQ